MTRKRFRTPPTLPQETQCRGTTVPASREWLGLYSDALLDLTHAYNYEQVEATDLTPEETAQAAYLQYLAWLDSTCDSGAPCPDPTIPEMDTPIYRQNPTTGRWEYIGPDGWEEPTGENAIPEPDDRPEATVPLQECGAASNAANSLKQLYDAILAVYDSQVEPTLNQIEIAAQIALAYGTIFGPVSSSVLAYSSAAWETFTYLLSEITMDDWTAAWEEELVCILNSNVEMVDGKAHFNYFEVNNALVGFILPVLDGFVRIRWQVWFLLQCIGSQGLDLAGATTDVEGDCVTCDTWCVTMKPATFGFTLGSGNGWFDASGAFWSQPNAGASQCSLVVNTTNCRITRVGMTTLRTGGGAQSYHLIRATPVTMTMQAANFANYGVTLLTADNAASYSSSNSTTVLVHLEGSNTNQLRCDYVKIMGTGINPFGIGSNC